MAASTRALLSVTAALALTGHPTTAGNRLAARHDAARLLRLFVLPPGARPLRSEPGGAGGLLAEPWGIPGGPRLDRHRLWHVHSPLDSVLAFERAHRPRGARLGGYGPFNSPRTPHAYGLNFVFPAVPGRLAERELTITMVALSAGWTGVRVDAQEIWIVTRPPSEVVPENVRELDIGPRRVTGPANVRRIVRWFDSLPVVQPVPYYCPMIRYRRRGVTFDFRAASGALLARARTPGAAACGSALDFSIRGRRQPPLLVDSFLVRVGRLVGMRLAPAYR
jgi:hypothetical protein